MGNIIGMLLKCSERYVTNAQLCWETIIFWLLCHIYIVFYLCMQILNDIIQMYLTRLQYYADNK